MGENRKRKSPITSPEDRLKCLLEFDKDENKKKTLSELAKLAKTVLEREEDFDKSTIHYWLKNKHKILAQAPVLAKRKKWPVKKLESDDAFLFSEALCEHFQKIANGKFLTKKEMIDEARKFHAEFWPDLKFLGRPPKVWINKYYITRLIEKKGLTCYRHRKGSAHYSAGNCSEHNSTSQLTNDDEDPADIKTEEVDQADIKIEILEF